MKNVFLVDRPHKHKEWTRLDGWVGSLLGKGTWARHSSSLVSLLYGSLLGFCFLVVSWFDSFLSLVRIHILMFIFYQGSPWTDCAEYMAECLKTCILGSSSLLWQQYNCGLKRTLYLSHVSLDKASPKSFKKASFVCFAMFSRDDDGLIGHLYELSFKKPAEKRSGLGAILNSNWWSHNPFNIP